MKYKEGNASKEDYLQMRNERLEWEEFFEKRKAELEKESKSTIRRMSVDELLRLQGYDKIDRAMLEKNLDAVYVHDDGRVEICWKVV